MNELQKELENVYQLIGMVPVKGDAVDLIAGARAGLRKAFQLAAEKENAPAETEE